MNILNEIAGNLNSFNHFFNSINQLFCQVRWLEANIRNSSPLLLGIVGVIILICLIVTFFHGESDSIQFLVIACVVSVVALFFYRRQALGPTATDFGSVMFGNNQSMTNNPDAACAPPKPVVRRIGPTGNIYNLVEPSQVAVV
jgi:hypothetical protein